LTALTKKRKINSSYSTPMISVFRVPKNKQDLPISPQAVLLRGLTSHFISKSCLFFGTPMIGVDAGFLFH
jgi:hypothetical protein